MPWTRSGQYGSGCSGRRCAATGWRIRRGDSGSAELATFVESVSADSPEGVTTALEAYLPSMSSAEAQQRLAVALIAMAVSDRARAVSDEQLGILLNARIEDAGGAPAGQGSLENLTPEEVERRVHQMLTANPALLDELTALLARGQAGAAEPQPALPGAGPEAGRHAARGWSRGRWRYNSGTSSSRDSGSANRI